MGQDFFLHPNALCESADVGSGTRIWAFAHVMKGARIGKDCNIGEQVFVEAGACIGDRVTVKNQVQIWEGIQIEDDAFIGPGAILTNDRYPRSPRMMGVPYVTRRYENKESWLSGIRIRKGATIGAGAILCPGLVIGPFAMIGAGSLVTRDVGPHELILGSPGRVSGHVCRCGTKLKSCDPELRVCPACDSCFSLEEFNSLRD